MRVTLSLIGICVLVFILQNVFFEFGFTEIFALTPVDALNGCYWQFITYMFLHGGTMHLFINMFVLFVFGITVEKNLGWQRYLGLFLISGIGSALFYLLLTGESTVLMLGASGAVFGVLTAYAFLFPRNWIIMFPGIPMPAIVAVVVFAVIELFFGVFGLEEGIANFGHLGGIITGVLFMLYIKWKRKREEVGGLKGFEFIWE